MELFSIHCTTCRARLKVNDASVVGMIMACPKCGSMVQVVPPTDWQPSPAVAAPAAVASSAMEPTASTPSVATPSAATSTSVPPALPPRAAAPSTATTSLATTPAVAPPEPATPSGPLTTVAQAALRLVRRDWLALSSGIALGTGVWLVIAIATSGTPETAAVVQPPAVAVEPNRTVAMKPVDPPIEPAQAEPVPAQAEVPATDQQPATEIKPAAASTDDANPPPPGETKTAETPAAPTAGATPTVKLEPMPASEPAPADAPLANKPSVDLQPDEPTEVGPVPHRNTTSPGIASRQLSASEIDDRLDQPLPNVEFSKTTLAKFVDFVRDLTGVPIHIDEAALAKTGQSVQSQLSLKMTDTTAGEALRTAAAKLKLECKVRAGQIVIGPKAD